MILGSDEMARTQQGNSNADCQDNSISWYDWALDQERRDRLAFTTLAIALRRAHRVVRRGSFSAGQESRPGAGVEVVWLWTDGTPMIPDRWNCGGAGVWHVAHGAALTDTDADGNVLTEDTFRILFNASWNPQTFALPPFSLGAAWLPVLDTTQDSGLARRLGLRVEATHLLVLLSTQ
jgi:isoamylase